MFIKRRRINYQLLLLLGWTLLSVGIDINIQVQANRIKNQCLTHSRIRTFILAPTHSFLSLVLVVPPSLSNFPRPAVWCGLGPIIDAFAIVRLKKKKAKNCGENNWLKYLMPPKDKARQRQRGGRQYFCSRDRRFSTPTSALSRINHNHL